MRSQMQLSIWVPCFPLSLSTTTDSVDMDPVLTFYTRMLFFALILSPALLTRAAVAVMAVVVV